MKVLIRIFKAFRYRLLSVIFLIRNKVELYYNDVLCDYPPTIIGKVFIRNQGTFKVGNQVKIVSSYGTNPIGGNTFSSFTVYENGILNIGNNVGISNSAICCRESICIGNDVFIGGDCKIYDTDFHSLSFLKRVKNKDHGQSRPVVIEDGVFIGTGTIILKGTRIGQKSVIGAGSVVTGIIPSNQVWAGNPARFIREIKENEV